MIFLEDRYWSDPIINRTLEIRICSYLLDSLNRQMKDYVEVEKLDIQGPV
jgi:hypothetical protein